MQAAERAFTLVPSLPLDEGDHSDAGALQGRRRLTGAFLIDIERLQPDPTQPRKTLDPVALRELTNSIRQLGILQPITVRYLPQEQVYQIIAGERRYLAAREAGLAEVPCWVQTPESREILVRQIVENWQRADLHPFDLADTLVQLRDQQNYSQKEIAELTGKPESEISKILSLLRLNPAVQHQYRRDKTGSLSRRHLESIAKLPDEEQVTFHAEVQQQGLTAQETERLVQKSLQRKEGANKRGAPLWTRRKINTPKGTVVVLLRRKEVSTEDIVEVLELARRQVQEESC